jgi:hypothetical protein
MRPRAPRPGMRRIGRRPPRRRCVGVAGSYA